jgi:hypothetical protein
MNRCAKYGISHLAAAGESNFVVVETKKGWFSLADLHAYRMVRVL